MRIFIEKQAPLAKVFSKAVYRFAQSDVEFCAKLAVPFADGSEYG